MSTPWGEPPQIPLPLRPNNSKRSPKTFSRRVAVCLRQEVCTMRARDEIDTRDTDACPDTLPEGCERVWIRESPEDEPPEGFEGRIVDADEIDGEDADDDPNVEPEDGEGWWG